MAISSGWKPGLRLKGNLPATWIADITIIPKIPNSLPSHASYSSAVQSRCLEGDFQSCTFCIFFLIEGVVCASQIKCSTLDWKTIIITIAVNHSDCHEMPSALKLPTLASLFPYSPGYPPAWPFTETLSGTQWAIIVLFLSPALLTRDSVQLSHFSFPTLSFLFPFNNYSYTLPVSHKLTGLSEIGELCQCPWSILKTFVVNCACYLKTLSTYFKHQFKKVCCF